MFSRNRTSSQVIGYGLYLYFHGLSFRNTSQALSFLKIKSWFSLKLDSKVQALETSKERKIKGYSIDETVIKAGPELIRIWVVIESTNKEILSFYISKERNMYLLKNEFCQRL